MSPLEAVLIWAAIVCYGITAALYIYSFVFKNDKMVPRLPYCASLGFLLHTAGMAARYHAVGNLPWASDYETASAGAWFVILFTLSITLKNRKLSGIGVGTVPFSLILLGAGVMRQPQLVPMAASLKSFWLGIHVFFAWLAFGGYAISSGTGIVYILKEKNPASDFYKKFPELPLLDDVMFKYLIFGFITDAVMIASGSIWAKDLWGNYWSWDPVEMWSLVTWLIYGLAIHLRVTMGWRGRRLAWLVALGIVGMVVSYFGINFFVSSSMHFFGAMK